MERTCKCLTHSLFPEISEKKNPKECFLLFRNREHSIKYKTREREREKDKPQIR